MNPTSLILSFGAHFSRLCFGAARERSAACRFPVFSFVCTAILLLSADLSAQVVRSTFDELLTQAPPSRRKTAHFGATVAVGDLDGNGYQELIVGAPDWRDSGGQPAGAVLIYRGTANGLVPWVQITETGATHAGAALAVGDFDGDGRQELAYGKPGWSGAASDAGGVTYVDWAPFLPVPAFTTRNLSQNGAVGDPPEAGDEFGAALAAGNFNNDAYDDLVVGIPGEALLGCCPLGDRDGAGAVEVFYGGAGGLATTANLFFSSDGGAQADERLGTSLATGYFNGDDYQDLAFGAPGYDVDLLGSSLATDVGRVGIIYGTSRGLTELGPFDVEIVVIEWIVANADLLNTPLTSPFGPQGTGFGSSLAAGDFNFTIACYFVTCYDDLAVGAPGVALNGYPGDDHGAVAIYGGTAGGLDSVAGIYARDQGDTPGASPEAGDRFGSVVAAGNFDGLGAIDLAVGVPDEAIGTSARQGLVHFFYGGDGTLSSTNYLTHTTGAAAPPLSGDRFGTSVVAGNFRGSSFPPDIAIGLPGRDLDDLLDAGGVEVIYGCLHCDDFESGDTTHWD